MSLISAAEIKLIQTLQLLLWVRADALSGGSERPHKMVSNFSNITSASIEIPGKDRVESDPADIWCCRCR